MKESVLSRGFGTSLPESFFIIRGIVLSTLKSRYRRSILGAFWAILAPLLTGTVYYFLSLHVLHINQSNFFNFLLSGILPWGLLTMVILQGMVAIVGQREVYLALKIPIYTFPLSYACSNLVHFLISYSILLAIGMISGQISPPPLMTLAYFHGALFFLALTLMLFFSILYIFIRDLEQLAPPLFQLWFFATPILYPAHLLEQKGSGLIFLNPVGHIFSGMSQLHLQGSVSGASYYWVPLLWMAAILALGQGMLRLARARILEEL